MYKAGNMADKLLNGTPGAAQDLMSGAHVYHAIFRSKMTGEEIRRTVVAGCKEEAEINGRAMEKILASGGDPVFLFVRVETPETHHTVNSFEEPSRPMGIIRRIDDLGRIVIPKEIRKYIGVREGDEMDITFMGRMLILTPVSNTPLDAVEIAISRLDEFGVLKQDLQNVIANYKRKAAKGEN